MEQNPGLTWGPEERKPAGRNEDPYTPGGRPVVSKRSGLCQNQSVAQGRASRARDAGQRR